MSLHKRKRIEKRKNRWFCMQCFECTVFDVDSQLGSVDWIDYLPLLHIISSFEIN